MSYFSRIARQTGLARHAPVPRPAPPGRTEPDAAGNDLVEVDAVESAASSSPAPVVDVRPADTPSVLEPIADTASGVESDPVAPPRVAIHRVDDPPSQRAAVETVDVVRADTTKPADRVEVPALRAPDAAVQPGPDADELVRRVLAWIAEGNDGHSGSDPVIERIAAPVAPDEITVVEARPAPASSDPRSPEAATPTAVVSEPRPREKKEVPTPSMGAVETVVQRVSVRERDVPVAAPRPREPVEDVVNVSIGAIHVKVDVPTEDAPPTPVVVARPQSTPAFTPARPTPASSDSRLRRRYLR